MKYFGCKNVEEFINEAEETQLWFNYKEGNYFLGLDGRGFGIQLLRLRGNELTHEENLKYFMARDDVKSLVNDYVLYDGVKLIDAMEMDL